MSRTISQIRRGTVSSSDSESEPELRQIIPQISRIKISGPVPGTVPLSDSSSENESQPVTSYRRSVNTYSSNKKPRNFGVVNSGNAPESLSESEGEPPRFTPNNGIKKGIAKGSDSDADSEPSSRHPNSVPRPREKPSVNSGSKLKDVKGGICPGIIESDDNGDSDFHSENSSSNNLKKQIPVKNPVPDISNTNTSSSLAKPPPQSALELPKEILDAFRESTLRPHTWRKELKKRAEQILRYDPITFACCVCTENYYKTDQYGKCSNCFTKAKSTIHTICRNCLVQATLPEYVNIDQRGRGIKCPTGDCDNILLMSEVQGFMRENHKEQLLERLGVMSIAAANLTDFYRCPACAFAVIVDDMKPNYTCPQCKRSNCKNCDIEYIGDHVGRTCREFVEYREQKIRDRAAAAVRVDEVAVHRCHRCNLQFIKDGGCNKMTCSCGATQCYLCRARDINYSHFGDDKPCQLFSDADEIERNRIEEERRRQGLHD